MDSNYWKTRVTKAYEPWSMSLARSCYYVKWCIYIWIYIYIYIHYLYMNCLYTMAGNTTNFYTWISGNLPIRSIMRKIPATFAPKKMVLSLRGKKRIGVSFPGLFPWEVVRAGLFFVFFSRRSWEKWCNGPAGDFGFSFIYQLLRLFEPRRAGRSSKRERLLGCKKHFSFWLFIRFDSLCMSIYVQFVGFQSADFRIGCWIQTNVSDHLLWGLVFDKACMYYVHGRYGK